MIKKMNKKTKFITVAVGLIVIMVIGIFIKSNLNKSAEEVIEEKIKKQISVQTLVKQNEIISTLTATGTVVPKQYSAIRSLTPGTVEYVAPAGTEISVGTPLFRLRDSGVETNYFNALQSLQQTNILTTERVAQSDLSLNSVKARYDLSEKNLETTIKQTSQALVNAKDSAITAYDTTYNTLQQMYDFLNTSSLSTPSYKYRSVVTTHTEPKEQAILNHIRAIDDFRNLPAKATSGSINEDLIKIKENLFLAKILIDNTVVVLQNALGGTEDLVGDKTVVAAYQTQINNHSNTILGSQNALNNIIINNELIIEQAKNQLELAKIELNNAEIGLANAKNSAELEKIISQSQVDNAAYSYGNLSLASPFSGTILSTSIEAGQQVAVGQQILELGNLNIVEIEVEIDTEFANTLKKGDKVLINDIYEGFISEIEPAGQINSGKVGVKVQSQNDQDFLTPGGIAEVTFNLIYKQDDLIIIPIKSATIESSNTFVFVAKDNKVEKKSIILGKVFGDQVSVTAGLDEGDKLILKNGVFISEGEEIEIIQ